METDSSLSHPQEPATYPYPEPASVQVRGFLYEWCITRYIFTARSC